MTQTWHVEMKGARSRRGGARGVRWPLLILSFAVGGLGLAGCSLDKLLNSDQLPAGINDPALTKTPTGAVAVYQETIRLFQAAFAGESGNGGAGVVEATGMISDELRTPYLGETNLSILSIADELRFSFHPDYASPTYSPLQKIRGQAGQAIGLLTDFAPGTAALAGHAYALGAYAEVFLADLFCSGVPLSTLDYNGDYTLRPGSSTDQVFAHAAALFDTALALAGDSVRFLHLAAVGKARALLARGQYAAAAAAVAAVPDGYRYDVRYDLAAGVPNFAQIGNNSAGWEASVSNQEGGNGLDYITSGDPRTPTVQRNGTYSGPPIPYTYYTPTGLWGGSLPVVLASGVEARLIEAEAALQTGDAATWLAKLDALRTDGTQTGGVDNPGTGGVAGLGPLADPGTADGRVDLLFRERAFWLFLTGHRQGDMRRLIRQYGRLRSQVYPTGLYPGGVAYSYGNDIVVPIPLAEQQLNPLFTGCASSGA